MGPPALRQGTLLACQIVDGGQAFRLSMIFSENRYALFPIMLVAAKDFAAMTQVNPTRPHRGLLMAFCNG
jgi:hypothetical protein